jgi:hypothetical protein
MRKMDRPFVQKAFTKVMLTAKSSNFISKYTNLLNLQYKSLKNFEDSIFDEEKIENKNITNTIESNDDIDKVNTKESEDKKIETDRNKKDVLKILGYDPFEFENDEDKSYLYNTLIDYLDENTQEDNFKLPACIELVKTFNQINQINKGIATITSNIGMMIKDTKEITALINAKEKMLKSVLALAKDNGISVNHSNNKSKGAGTLSGIMKKLQELGFEESNINLFNVETIGGIKQVADISNKSILNQLMFDENDYTEMIKEQKILIDEFRDKAEKLEEENRNLKMKIQNMKDGGL